MMSLAGWMGILGGLAAAAQVFASVSRHVRRVKAGHAARLRQLGEVRRDMRERARATLDLRREERAMQRELVELTGQIDSGEKTVQRKKSAETLLYVFDERRNPGDQAFIVPIAHPRFADIARHPPEDVSASWVSGRRFLVWAASDKMASAKANMRFPADRGYVVGALEPYAGNSEEL